MGWDGKRQRIEDAYGVIVIDQWRTPVVLHDIRDTREVRPGEWHDFTMCGIDAGSAPHWVNLRILDPTKTRPCQRCWLP